MPQRALLKLSTFVVFCAVTALPAVGAAREASVAGLGEASSSASSSLEDLRYRLFDSRARALAGFAIGSLAGLVIGGRRKDKLEEGNG